MNRPLEISATTTGEARQRVLEAMAGLRNGTVSAEQAKAVASELKKINKRMTDDLKRMRAEQQLPRVLPVVVNTL